MKRNDKCKRGQGKQKSDRKAKKQEEREYEIVGKEIKEEKKRRKPRQERSGKKVRKRSQTEVKTRAGRERVLKKERGGF